MNKKRIPAASPAEICQARGSRTQIEIAQLLGVSRATVQNWENGRSPISRAYWFTLQNLAK